MEMTPNVHPDDDLAAIAADLADALHRLSEARGWTHSGALAHERYERWLREQQAAHPVRPKQDVLLP